MKPEMCATQPQLTCPAQPMLDLAQAPLADLGWPSPVSGRRVNHTFACALPGRGSTCDCGADSFNSSD